MLKHDTTTGRLIVGNGGKGTRIVEWVRLVSQLIVIPLVVAGFLWVVKVETNLARLNGFAGQGQRFVGTQTLPNAEVLRDRAASDAALLIAAHSSSGAHPGIDLRVVALESKVISNGQKLDEILRRLPR